VSATEDEKRRIEATERDYPGFQVWVGPVSKKWSGRLIADSAGPGDVLTGEDEQQLRGKLDEWLGQRAARIDAAADRVADSYLEALDGEEQDGPDR
jgi:hypothetical protein